jgi:hypothetical protein
MSLGFIVGPAAGGLLSARVGQMAPALVAALLYLVDFVIVFFFVDEQRQQHHPPAPTPPSLPTHDEKSERVKESNNDRTSDDEGGQEDTIVKEDTKATTGVVRQLKLVWEVFARPKVGRLLLIKFMIHLAMAMGRANFGLFMLERFGLGPEVHTLPHTHTHATHATHTRNTHTQQLTLCAHSFSSTRRLRPT